MYMGQHGGFGALSSLRFCLYFLWFSSFSCFRYYVREVFTTAQLMACHFFSIFFWASLHQKCDELDGKRRKEKRLENQERAREPGQRRERENGIAQAPKKLKKSHSSQCIIAARESAVRHFDCPVVPAPSSRSFHPSSSPGCMYLS